MPDPLKKHRIIGIRHTLKKIKEAGLISDGVIYPEDAVEQLSKTKKKADGARRHRTARSDAPIDSIVKKIEKTFTNFLESSFTSAHIGIQAGGRKI